MSMDQTTITTTAASVLTILAPYCPILAAKAAETLACAHEAFVNIPCHPAA